MKSLKEQIAELRMAGYKTLAAQAKVVHDAVLLAMHRSGFKLKSSIKGGVVLSSLTGDIRRATMDMDIDFIHHSISIRSIEQFVRGLDRVMPELERTFASSRYMRKLESARNNWLAVSPQLAAETILKVVSSL